MFVKKKSKRGFSLIELSIVILIISILAAGAISVSGSFLVSAKNKQTKDKMEAIYKAIGNYVAKNYHLPCPAPLTDTKSDSGYGNKSGGAVATNTAVACGDTGVYSSSDVSTISYGMVPVNTLGLSDDMAQDGFGSRFSYVVVDKLASPNYNDTSGGETSFGFSYYDESASDMIQIVQATSGNTIENIAFAVISHGANKLGSYNSTSTTQNSTTGIGTEESYNVLSNIVSNTADYGQNPSYTGRVSFTSLDSDEDFDDTMIYKSREEIIADFNLEHLYFCDASDTGYTNYESGYSNAYKGQLVYRSTDCTDPAGVYPSKECARHGSNKSWINKVTCVTN